MVPNLQRPYSLVPWKQCINTLELHTLNVGLFCGCGYVVWLSREAEK